ncbi:carboxypeptidase regulatory-like domain-containing protein [Bacillus sp. ISL-75]|uniref:carboxypeptidase-like regulatory domain-containing protein n=1 Tax=Bacillus sp. ISL-75 TaxID=2819137 RepID=UPI001BE53C9C|nr:carboxypeptidase-like regulatory domain-containing protein [Bacillus sp. ISL-75]MBT2730535.1 carboxypeptidase regulatory-like domain-containing protein [Bacillus sp. ISL-75]
MGKKIMYMLLLLVCIMGVTNGIANAAPTKGHIPAVVKGSIKESGKPLKNTLVTIREKGKLNWIQTMTDGKGSFQTKLSDGTYTVKGVKGKNTTWYSTNQSFVVSKGKIKGLKEDEINLSDKKKEKKPLNQSSNFNGVLKEGSNGLKADLIIYGEHDEEIYTVSSIGNGSFSASLPDGHYFLFGIEVDNGFYRYELGFTVEDGKVLVDGKQQTNLSIDIPVDTIMGKVGDTSKPLSEAGVVLEKYLSDKEYDTEFIQYVVTNNQGKFSLRALADGTYTISVYHETYSSWNNVTFEVVEGTVYVAGRKASLLEITVPDINVTGVLSEGRKPITDAYVNFEGETSDGVYYGYGTPVDSKGSFQYRLHDGSYTVTYINEQNRGTRVNIPFEVRGGKLIQNGKVTSSLDIDLPPVTFNGKLLDSGAALQGVIYIETLSKDGSYEWYDAITDENGIFSLRLKDGSYQVRGGYLFEEGQDVSLSTKFDIINGKLFIAGQEQSILELQVPPVSVHGLVKDGEMAVSNGFILVSSADESFYGGKSLNQDGTFTMRLADGDYTVREIYLEDGTNAFIDLSFSIMDGKTYVNDQLKDVLEISVPPITLTGTLTEKGNPIMGDLYIMEMNDADNPVQSWGWANEEGRFQFRLPDGDYKVYEVYLYDGTAFRPGTEFSIVTGQLYVNGELTEQLDIAAAPITVSGTVYNGEKPVTDGYVEISSKDGNWSGSNWIQNGRYQFRLPDGEYQLSSVEDFQHGHLTLINHLRLRMGNSLWMERK